MTIDNLDIWNKLGKTDPKHTKGFKRAGGFGGTAIKPIYTIQKMTEVFGPASQGWGTDEPLFQVIPGNDGQVAVYCTVALWTGAQNGGGRVYGVGGDMVVVKQSAGLRTDDEAFKKAFTDAVGNAMKHLGMSADVHMGLFDDSKYVREREEEERTGAVGGRVPANTTANMPMDDHTAASSTVSDSTAKLIFPALQSELQGCATRSQLDGAWERWLTVIVNWSDSMQEHCEEVRQQMVTYLAEHGGDARSANADIIEADLRAAINMDDLKAKWSGWGDAMRKLGKDDVIKLSEAKEQVKKAIIGIGKMPAFDALTPEEQHAVKIANTP